MNYGSHVPVDITPKPYTCAQGPETSSHGSHLEPASTRRQSHPVKQTARQRGRLTVQDDDEPSWLLPKI